jgi:hypothetical protein
MSGNPALVRTPGGRRFPVALSRSARPGLLSGALIDSPRLVVGSNALLPPLHMRRIGTRSRR